MISVIFPDLKVCVHEVSSESKLLKNTSFVCKEKMNKLPIRLEMIPEKITKLSR